MTNNIIAPRSVSDKMLLAVARLSAFEIEEKTGIPAVEALQRVDAMLANRGHLNQRQQELLLLVELGDVIMDARTRLPNSSDRDYAAIANVILRGAKDLLDRIAEARRGVEIDISEITAGQARTFGNAYDVSTDAMFRILKKRYSDLTDADINDLKRQGMFAAAQYLEEHTGEE